MVEQQNLNKSMSTSLHLKRVRNPLGGLCQSWKRITSSFPVILQQWLEIKKCCGEIMSSRLAKVFEDEKLVKRIKKRLPYLFQLAELESSRAGRIGMEVGSLREKILVALLVHRFGEENVTTEIPITEREIDARLFRQPVSVKTITGGGFSGVKLIWTVDTQKAKEFRETYYPRCDILLARIKWNSTGRLYYIPVETQQNLFNEIGRNRYTKLPKPGTNPR